MNIQLLDDGERIRKTFMDKYILSYDAFCIVNSDWIETIRKNKYVYDIERHESSLMWDRRMIPGFSSISFLNALTILKAIPGDVLFMSEGPGYQGSCALNINGEHIRNFVATANACELADQIAYEWFESYRLYEKDIYMIDTVLPEDLYVFDRSLEWVIVFTHETDWNETDAVGSADTRYCKIYGMAKEKAEKR